MRISIADCRLQRNVRSARFLICALTLGLAASNQARAVSLCVSTAVELQEALSDASDGGLYSGYDVEIDLVQGTYFAPENGPFLYTSTAATGQISVMGGWNSQCDGFSHNAALTVLDANHNSQVLSIDNSNADVDVELLTIQNGETFDEGGGLAINSETASPGASVYVAFNIIRNNQSFTTGGGVSIYTSGSVNQVDLLTNVITGNTANDFGAGLVNAANVGVVYITGNTVYGNTAVAVSGSGSLYCCGDAANAPAIYANIFWQNTKYGLYTYGTAADLEYNDYGTLSGVTPDQNIGNTSINPKFLDAANGDFHLSGTSSLLGYSPPTINGVPAGTSTDVSGNYFPQTGKRDVGAYSETIFTDGFDGD